jgi:5-(carboxyamino)imidazole ribonucleotide synthase
VSEIGGKKFILKTTRLGYDGKGQLVHRLTDDPEKSWRKLNASELILEEMVDFSCEVSVIIARDMHGQSALYGPVLNEHKNHILSRSIVPAPIHERTAERARETAHLLADAAGLIGVLAPGRSSRKTAGYSQTRSPPHITPDTGRSTPARAHSSSSTCARRGGLPVGEPARHSDAEMINLIGNDVSKIAKWYKTETRIHLYGKSEIKDGRKMGRDNLKPLTRKKR